MAITSSRIEINRLNANPNPKHFSYKIPGLLAWGVLIFCSISLMVARRLLLDVARVVAIYVMIRLIIYTIFYLAGRVKIHAAEKQTGEAPFRGLTRDEVAQYQHVQHLVVVPNYCEPLEILSRTLQSLSLQAEARHNLTVVLAMEEREPQAKEKAETLLALFNGRFFGLSALFHPANLPGEAAGKATNLNWAVRHARQEIVEQQGITSEQVIVTVVDSDEIIHPCYFVELTRRFATDARRHAMIWQAPILLDNDIWRTNAIIRLVTFFSNAVTSGDMNNPWEARFPYSSYSISLNLLEEVNYWDPWQIAEDVNIFMRAYFSKGGRVFIQRIHLPVRANPVYGANLWHSIGIFFAQKVRQGWGGAEIGYMIQKWNYPTSAPLPSKLWNLFKLVHDHLFFSTAGIVVALGTILSIIIDHNPAITLPPGSPNPLFFIILNLAGGSALLVTWVLERVRLTQGRKDWSVKILLAEMASWVIFPVTFFVLMNLPILLAQTRMLLGQTYTFQRTPKGFDAKFGE